MSEFSDIVKLVRDAHTLRSPGKLFGDLSGDPQMLLEVEYRRLAKIIHPDVAADKVAATTAFALFQEVYTWAVDAVKNGTYSVTASMAVVKSKHGEYTFLSAIAAGDVSDVWLCKLPDGSIGIAKIGIVPMDNDLMKYEAQVLRALQDNETSRGLPFFPTVIDSFTADARGDGKRVQVNILQLFKAPTPNDSLNPTRMYTLSDVKKAYPNGVDPRDMAWIWRRLLMALSHVHVLGYTHGAINPDHILIDPVKHAVVLIGWTMGAAAGSYIKTIPPTYESWYPKWVFDKGETRPQLDISLGGKSMLHITDKTIPASLASYFRRITGDIFVPDNALQALDDFDDLIAIEWGDRKFRVFPAMPDKSA